MTNLRQPAVVTTGVRKSFGETVVLDNVDLAVAEGTILALLGPNGAGKTTMVRILSTLIPADAGTVRKPAIREVSFFFRRSRSLGTANGPFRGRSDCVSTGADQAASAS